MNQSSAFQPPDRLRVDEQIAASIADAILDGVFPPGSTLPPERDLAAQFGSTARRCGRGWPGCSRWA
ncbi:bacterial regulatory s, gntR family protein [Mycobacterium kansasii]|uniref:Bacterial regulatory s, gntR family protein n=1 Tax=Mycobacterium kansasii TaxID=1768 RepID=A0A1V3WP10_MYCKA|nr:bacterial regulatory s, gntR family protein [Mycobacterium kansasii]